MLWIKKNKRFILLTATLLLNIIAGLVLVNNTIEMGRKEQTGRLAIEEKTINEIRTAAELSVYAFEAEELYRREGINLTYHIFSSEELVREKGTMLVDKRKENLKTVFSGGHYAQISEWSGVYTYDRKVIDAFSDLEWRGFYSSKRYVDLNEMAVFNDLRPEEALTISDGKRIETKNVDINQFLGAYQVQLVFSELKAENEGDVLLLEVNGEAGERRIFEVNLKTTDFDESGKCVYTVCYETASAPKVTYAVTAYDGVTVTVESISWWRVS